jgi:predicted transcriptional regulator
VAKGSLVSKINGSTPSLEQRIAAALANQDIAAADLQALIAETNAAIAQATATAESERAKAYDPALSPDPKAARAAMEDAHFIVGRLQTLLPRLHAHHTRRQHQEKREQWRAEATTFERARDALAQEFAEVYPRAVGELVSLMARTAALEQDIERLNRAAPSGEGRLVGVENTARGLPLVDRLPTQIRTPIISRVASLRTLRCLTQTSKMRMGGRSPSRIELAALLTEMMSGSGHSRRLPQSGFGGAGCLLEELSQLLR